MDVNPSFCRTFSFCSRAQGSYLHPGCRASLQQSTEPSALVVCEGRGAFAFMPKCCVKPSLLFGPSSRKSTLGSLSEARRLKCLQGQAGEVV